MAAYFTGGGAGTDVVQAAGTDGLQTLYLMNPSYVGFTDAATAPGGASNVMFLNSTVSTLTPARFGHHHQQPTPAAQHFVGIPLQPAPHSGYNLWGPDTTGAATGNDVSPPRHGQQQAPAAGTSAAVAAVSPVLSLSSREAAPPVTVAAAAVPGGTEHEQQVVMRSRYLKAAQELLDEAVSVSKGATAVKKKEDSEGGVSGGGGGGGGGGGVDDGGDSKSGGAAAEMSTAERQELQMKKSKLLNMLDEVEQRYRQYHRQMQAVAAAFEAAAGAGSARTYTSLALRTISRQFRCLRDAIAAQVRAASRGLGEDCGDEDGSGGRTTVGSRLRFIDSQLRQQRAMQQLGMVHAAGGGGGGGWRPQRGLPERAVSVLRAWLFEHFLHPYPKDSDKVMLAKQTGLTRSQVSNWFINARVRLWKPMVEEMYAEETKAKEEEEHDAAATAVTGGGSNDSVAEQPPDKPESAGIGMSSSPAATTSRSAGVHAGVQQTQASFYGGGGDAFQCRIKKARTTADEPTAAFHVSDEAAVSHRELLMKFMEAGGEGARGHPGVIDDDDDDVAGGNGGYSLFTPAPYVHQFGSEHFAFAGHGGGGVSLTLGLPHGADQTPASFLMGASTGGSDGGAPVTTAGYDMNMQSTKSLAAQLMRDFVA